ncbi:tyrosine protein phosphatase [Clostridia bacterium]|nr:tyrosine protein phosphatase [Clostridia bacterium]
MIDFHTHILPGIDDGSQSVDESVQMLMAQNEQNTEAVILSPHYYHSKEPITSFLDRRETAFRILKAQWKPKTPILMLGAEVAFYVDMTKDADIHRLCVAGTDVLLLEMPFTVWRTPMINEVYSLITNLRITPIIVHIERYINEPQNLEALRQLITMGAIIQGNAEFFLKLRTRRRAFTMLGQGQIQVFGSDCHNMTKQKPNMEKLEKMLNRKLKIEKSLQLLNYSRSLLSNAESF